MQVVVEDLFGISPWLTDVERQAVDYALSLHGINDPGYPPAAQKLDVQVSVYHSRRGKRRLTCSLQEIAVKALRYHASRNRREAASRRDAP